MSPESAEIRRTLDAVWRLEYPRILGGVVRLVRDVDTAEQLAQDAMVAALEQWPVEGLPENPGAWLTTAARHRAIDHLRRARRVQHTHAELARDGEPVVTPPVDDEFGDDVLRLMFLSCHPVIPAEARTALTLRLLTGLSTDEIARAQLVPEPTVAQRIVRAKRTLVDQQVAFELPARGAVAERLASVLEVLYLLFNEGYAATAGAAWTRADLCAEAVRLGRVLAARLPDEPEVQALLALMELQASRLEARTGDLGDPVRLLEQDRSRWHLLSIRRGLAALDRAIALGGEPGPYRLQAEIAACHARAATPADTDWQRIVALYGELAELLPSPVVELNRAVAVAMAFGPVAGLYLLDGLTEDPALRDYHLLPAVRGELLARLGRDREAAAELERALAAAGNDGDRALLQQRLSACRRRLGGAGN